MIVPLNLIKLCVGCGSSQELATSQIERAEVRRSLGDEHLCYHDTRHRPRRAVEIVDGGSLYWVMRGFIVARQKITDFVELVEHPENKKCRIVLDLKLVDVVSQPFRPFQGWRYFEAEKAPDDLIDGEKPDEEVEQILRDLSKAGLI